MRMKNKKWALVGLIGIVLILGASTILTIHLSGKEKEQTEAAVNIEYLAAYTDCEIFKTVPALRGEDSKIGEGTDLGDENYVLDINGATLDEYRAYIDVLIKDGFQKHSDNGEEGMEGYVYTTSLKKDDLTLVVSHVVKQNKTYIAATKDLALSDYLIYDDKWSEGTDPSAKTKLHMLQLNNNGNSFVIQLKNGHFVLHDGGTSEDAPYLLDYLEELTPGDEKPVIDAWFISHAHADHNGAFWKILSSPADIERICVEGIYFTNPPKEITKNAQLEESVWYITKGYVGFKNASGKNTTLYRPQLGQRYYFCDISIDVALTTEQIPLDNYFEWDFNDTSIWLMHNIEGQKFLCSGDTHHSGMRQAMSMYPKEYLDVEVLAVFHHGINLYQYFTDYITYDTALYTNWRVGSLWVEGTEGGNRRPDLVRTEDNAYFQAKAKECISHGDGTVVLTFPYHVGEAEILAPCDWRYNDGSPVRPLQE